MKILAIDTSSARGSVALLDDDVVLAEQSLGEGSRHGRDLVPCVDRVLGGRADLVELLAVDAGPGSHTGIRVGITFAKTFGMQTDVPVVTVSSLDVLAANVMEHCPLCVVVDARLKQVYAALYDAGHAKVVDDLAASPQDIAARIEGRGTAVVGDGLRRYREVFAGVARVLDDESLWWPRAANAGRLARAKFDREGGEDPHALEPRYLRRPQAEVVWERRQNASGPK